LILEDGKTGSHETSVNN